MTTATTRRSTEHSIFGSTQPLPKSQLPTSADVFRAYHYYLKFNNSSSLYDRSSMVAQEVKQIYDAASIPTIEIKSITKRVQRLVNKVQELGKYSECKKSSQKYKEKVENFHTMFDVCCCNCFDHGARERSACTCS